MKKILPALVLLILSTLLSGCWDRKEINDLGLVVGIAFDYAELEGGKPGVKFTVQVANPTVLAAGGPAGAGGTGGAGGTTEAKPFWTVSETGETVRGAIAKMNYRVPRQIFFGHDRLNVFGEKAARSGLAPFMDRLLRSRESRENNYCAVAKGGDGSRIMELESPVFRATALALNDIFRDKNGWQAVMPVTMAEFTYRLSTGVTCPVSPVVEIVPQKSLTSEEKKSGGTKDTVAVSGLAAFDQDGRLVDFLNERETMGLMWVLNRAKLRVLTIPHSIDGAEESISLNLLRSKSKTVVSMGEDGMPSFDIKVKARFDILEHFGSHPGLFDVNFIDGLEKKASSQIINEIEVAVKKGQQLNTDVFEFGEEVHRQHKREWRQLKDHWREIFPEVNVTIECEARVEDRGLTVETPGSRKEGGEQ